ncbi:hypothetical protein PG994_008319 [Apiospora phragmitis]|uniref:Uncharacterized protein n=1 Tax=Apiospora phragmitis TaxID=2905665 RepID=A0ABR1UVT7_9PEZI
MSDKSGKGDKPGKGAKGNTPKNPQPTTDLYEDMMLAFTMYRSVHPDFKVEGWVDIAAERGLSLATAKQRFGAMKKRFKASSESKAQTKPMMKHGKPGDKGTADPVSKGKKKQANPVLEDDEEIDDGKTIPSVNTAQLAAASSPPLPAPGPLRRSRRTRHTRYTEPEPEDDGKDNDQNVTSAQTAAVTAPAAAAPSPARPPPRRAPRARRTRNTAPKPKDGVKDNNQKAMSARTAVATAPAAPAPPRRARPRPSRRAKKVAPGFEEDGSEIPAVLPGAPKRKRGLTSRSAAEPAKKQKTGDGTTPSKESTETEARPSRRLNLGRVSRPSLP